MTRLPTGSLVITVGKEGPHYEGKWRWNGRQLKRRLGPAWLDPVSDKFAGDERGLGSGKSAGTRLDPGSNENAGVGQAWKKRPGRPQEGFLSERDAYLALTAMIASHAAQEEQERSQTPTFAQAAERWYERAVRRQRKPTTLAAYRHAIDAYILGKSSGRPTSQRIKTACPFADKLINRVSKLDVRGWLDPIPHSRTKERVFKYVKSILDYAISEEWISENVAKSVDCHVVPYDGSYDYFSADEIERLIEAAEDPYDAALYATAAFTGLRRGELFALQWRDIDFEHARLRVVRNLTLDTLVTPKNGKARVVPLVPALVTRLRALKRKRINRPTGFVFAPPVTSVTGWPHPWGNHEAARVRYQKALKCAGLRRLPFHSLRHSFGSHAVNVATLVQVKNWMGHSDLRTTGRYLHARNLDTDADLLAAAF